MAGHPNRLSRFWQELKRRRVLHVITVYATASFAIIEVIGNLTEPLNLPTSLSTIIIIVLAVGFPPAIILSWLYDLTSGTFERTKPLDETEEEVEPVAVPNAWKIATYVSFAVIVGLVVLNIFSRNDLIKSGMIKSMVVLPFDNYTGDEQLDYVAAGMHASLIGDIGKLGALRVIGTTSSNVFKNTDKSAPDIAEELNVDLVIEPTLTCYGDTVCVLIRAVKPFPEEKQIWVAEYREDKSKILSLYNRVTKQIADKVKVELTPKQEQLLKDARTVNSNAYDHYLKGLYYWDQFTPEALQLALEYFHKAIEIDPDWADPYAGVAYFWVALHQFSLAPPSVTIPNMYSSLNKAIELDPNSGFVHYVNGLVSVWTGYEWEKGEKEFLQLLENNPNHALGHMYYAHLLSILRKVDEALLHCRIALNLDPLNPMIQSLSTLVLSNAGEYEESISMAKKVLAVIPDQPVAIANLSGTYMITGEQRKSLEYWMQFSELDGNSREEVLSTFDQKGFDAALNLFINQLEKAGNEFLPMDFGQLYALAGNEVKAMYCYKKALQERSPMLPYITTVYHDGGPFKLYDTGFDSLLIKLNLPLD
jgi:TolB-like protein/Tfp pilus assembly protein PilF